VASLLRATGPFRHQNVRLYSWFSIAFNARFYYPIFAILFLDLGLSMEQFVTLNAIWATTIFLSEVPSGALADIIGRKRLLVTSGALMMAEMAALLFAPKDAGVWLFSICVINRILSGLAEAAASGADEALAYDSLEKEGEEELWDEVLETTMRWKAAAMVMAMILGAALYDANFVGRFFDVTPDQSLRFPIALCLAQAVLAFFIALRFRELPGTCDETATIRGVIQQTWKAARWVFTTKMAILIVLGALIIDAVARNFATVNSEYYRLINLPAYSFGFIAAGADALGVFIPRLSKHLVQNFSPLANLTGTALLMLGSLVALAPTWDFWGLLPALVVMAGLGHLGFLVSRYLNDLSSSKQRATVLSVKGLLFNIGYGAMVAKFLGMKSSTRRESGPKSGT